MSIQRYYLKNSNFILTKMSGKISNQQLKQHIIELNKETKCMSSLRGLTDCRKITDVEKLTINGATNAAQLVEAKREGLSAILISDSKLHYGIARAFQIFHEENRKAVQIFKDMNEALSWISIDDKEILVLRNFIDNAG